jgi:hypothetical protein
MRRRTQWLFGAALLGLILVAVQQVFGSSEPEMVQAPPDVVAPTSSEGVGVRVGLEQSEAWLDHLGDGGSIRLLVAGERASEASILQGQGKLDGSDRVFARSCIEKVVGARKRDLVAEYQANESGKSNAVAALREAEAQVKLLLYEAFLSAFDKDHYCLVDAYEKKPPVPPGHEEITFGVLKGGKQFLCVVVVRKADYGLDEVEQYAARARAAYLHGAMHDFNSRGDDERAAMIARYDANSAVDRDWRSETFPPGLVIDRHRLLLVMP